MEQKQIQLTIQNVSKKFRIDKGTLSVLEDISLEIEKGEFISIVGTSGCGKSTLLKMIIGLDPPTEGHIRIDGREVVKPAIDCGMVFQEARRFFSVTASLYCPADPVRLWTR